jgi:hypothetical protein
MPTDRKRAAVAAAHAALQHNLEEMPLKARTGFTRSEKAKSRTITKAAIKAIRGTRAAMLQQYSRYTLVAVINIIAHREGKTDASRWVRSIIASEPHLIALSQRVDTSRTNQYARTRVID